jgi:hypothetical protein
MAIRNSGNSCAGAAVVVVRVEALVGAEAVVVRAVVES